MELQYDLLDNNAYLMINDIRKKYVEEYKLVFLIAKLMDKIMSDEDCKRFNKDREKYIICTIYDCYMTYSAEILLLERGLVSDYNVLLRTFYEKKFKLFAVVKNKRNYNKLVDEYEYYSTSFAKQIKDNQNNMFDDLVDKIDYDEYDFDNYENKKMSTESWANNGSLKKEYERQYSVLSQDTHYGIGSLSKKLKTDPNDKVLYLTYSYENFTSDLVIASMEMVICIDNFFNFIKCDKYKHQLSRIDKQIKKIVKQVEEISKK